MIIVFVLFFVLVVNADASYCQSDPAREKLVLVKQLQLEGGNFNAVANRSTEYRGSVAVSPDSQQFLGGSGETLIIMDGDASSYEKLQLQHRPDFASFSGNGGVVVLYEFAGRSATVIDLKSRSIVSTISSPDKIDKLVVSRDGRRIATTRSEGGLLGKGRSVTRLWDATDGRIISEIFGCAGTRLMSPQFTSDARSLLIECERLIGKPIKLFDVDTGRENLSLRQDDQYAPPESAISPDGLSIVSIYRTNGIRVWDVKSGSLRKEFVASQGSINDITFSKDGRWFATIGFSPVVRTWETRTGEKYRVYETGITKSPSFIVRTVFSESGAMLAGIDKRGRITVWDTKNAGIKFVLNETATKEDFSVNAFFGRDDRVLIVRRDKAISVFDTKAGREIQRIPNPTGMYHLDPGSAKLVVLNSNNSISIWSAE